MMTVSNEIKRKKTRKPTLESKVRSKVCLDEQEFRSRFKARESGRPYKCNECSQTFKSKDSHQRHKFNHEGKKPFLCAICGKGFRSNQILKEHTAMHNKEMLYRCCVCKRNFRHHSALSRHSLLHKNQPNHMCHVCGQRFLTAEYLSTHMRSHSGERCFTCKICHQQFKHASSLSRHSARHHRESKKNKVGVLSKYGTIVIECASKHENRSLLERTNYPERIEVEMGLKNGSFCTTSQESALVNEVLEQYRISAQLEDKKSKSIQNYKIFTLERLTHLAQKFVILPFPFDIHVFKDITHMMKQLADAVMESVNYISESQFQHCQEVLNNLQLLINENLWFMREKCLDKCSNV